MSFALDDEQNQDQQQGGGNAPGGAASNANQGPLPDSGVSLGGGAGAVGPGTPGGSAQPAAAKPSSSGSWTNLQSYLNANQDQGAQVGSQIAGTVSGQAKSALDDVNSAASDFSSNVNAGVVNADPNAINTAISDATSAKAGGSLNPDEASGFQKQLNASYGGPTDFTQDQGYGKAQQSVDRAQQAVQETGSEAGRDVLLGNQYGATSQNGYNQGEKNFDQLLLENSQGGQAALQPIQNQWAGLGSALSNATTAAGGQVQQAQAIDAATAAQAKAALDQANSKFQSGVNAQAQAAQTASGASYDQLSNDLKNGTLTADEARSIGVIQGQDILNLDPSQYLSRGTAPTLYNSATADQYAQAQALAGLAGQSSSAFLPGQYASQAGTAGPAYSFDKSRFATDEASANAAFNAELQKDYALGVDPTAGQGVFGGDIVNSIPAVQQQRQAAEDAAIQATDQKYGASRGFNWGAINGAIS